MDDTTRIIADVVMRISMLYGVSPHALMDKSKQRHVCEARYIAYTYLHYEIGLSSIKIGKYFNRSRFNVLRGIRILRGWMGYHTETKTKVESIINTLKGGD